MATRAIQGEASASPAMPLDLILSAIPSLPRPLLSRLTARLIEHMDEMDGDPDAEQTSDEGEPDFITKAPSGGPGCLISDPDYGAEDMGEDCRGGDVCEDYRPIADPQAYDQHRNRIRHTRTYLARRIDCRRWGGTILEDRRLFQEPSVPSKRQLLRRKRGMPRRPRG